VEGGEQVEERSATGRPAIAAVDVHPRVVGEVGADPGQNRPGAVGAGHRSRRKRATQLRDVSAETLARQDVRANIRTVPLPGPRATACNAGLTIAEYTG